MGFFQGHTGRRDDDGPSGVRGGAVPGRRTRAGSDPAEADSSADDGHLFGSDSIFGGGGRGVRIGGGGSFETFSSTSASVLPPYSSGSATVGRSAVVGGGGDRPGGVAVGGDGGESAFHQLLVDADTLQEAAMHPGPAATAEERDLLVRRAIAALEGIVVFAAVPTEGEGEFEEDALNDESFPPSEGARAHGAGGDASAIAKRERAERILPPILHNIGVRAPLAARVTTTTSSHAHDSLVICDLVHSLGVMCDLIHTSGVLRDLVSRTLGSDS